jgi:hypothetical protein
MNARTDAPSRTEAFDEVTKWGVGGGMVLTALAPLSLPILILTVVALLPLVVPLLAVGLLAGAIALPIMLIRKLASSVMNLRQPRPSQGRSEPATRTAGQA